MVAVVVVAVAEREAASKEVAKEVDEGVVEARAALVVRVVARRWRWWWRCPQPDAVGVCRRCAAQTRRRRCQRMAAPPNEDDELTVDAIDGQLKVCVAGSHNPTQSAVSKRRKHDDDAVASGGRAAQTSSPR